MNSIETNPTLSRNLGFWSIEEQQAISGASVAIAGAGGDGGVDYGVGVWRSLWRTVG
jgi:hypothetical protein